MLRTMIARTCLSCDLIILALPIEILICSVGAACSSSCIPKLFSSFLFPLYSAGFSIIHSDAINMGLPIVYFTWSQVEFSKL